MNISITGCIGAGKSSICKELEQSGYKTVTAGSVFRQLAKEKEISINDAISGNADIDNELDHKIEEIGKTEDKIVFDSRMAWHFVPDSFKVFVYVDEDIAAQRVFNADRETEKFNSLEECKNGIRNRQLSEKENYMNLYGCNYLDSSNYDLIIDSTYATPKEVAGKIIECMDKQHDRFQMNPRSLYPTQGIRNLSEERLSEYVGKVLKGDGIKISTYDGYFGIVDGHHRQLASAINKEPFIGASYVQDSNNPIVSKSEIYNHEDVASFFYENYPEDTKKDNPMLDFSNENKMIQKNLSSELKEEKEEEYDVSL